MGYNSSEERKIYMKKYFKTKHGVLKRIYHHMKERSKNNSWILLDLEKTLVELKKSVFIPSKYFDKLYKSQP